MAQRKPLIAVPIGDPAGVGPEIVAKACAQKTVNDAADVVVIGDRRVMENAIRIVGADLKINVIGSPAEGDYRSGILNLIDLDNIDQSGFQYGVVQAMCGRAAFAYIEKSIRLAMDNEADAVATTPINKEALHAAEVPFIGHTEIFGALTGTPDPLTMFETNGLRVFFLTRHKSLRDMLDDITKENIKACVKESLAALARLGVTEGTMAVAGLNPHCGEHGLFGWEEVSEITPAVEELRAEGYPVAGPIGADSVFHQAALGRYNSVLSLYHDQGHIATKTLDFDRTISITNGMPILRTSVDHGTAFDIAGKGIASEISMAEAILLAARYAPFFKK
ncbi:MAG: 4-hydroxythreonine-4-phosphate dehydrogenase PdxA [Eubacteriales bacterium]|nr:4-hydroxythreonine-4-phosphate dehydrogenase PdxA [Eubacteriales bacterium]